MGAGCKECPSSVTLRTHPEAAPLAQERALRNTYRLPPGSRLCVEVIDPLPQGGVSPFLGPFGDQRQRRPSAAASAWPGKSNPPMSYRANSVAYVRSCNCSKRHEVHEGMIDVEAFKRGIDRCLGVLVEPGPAGLP